MKSRIVLFSSECLEFINSLDKRSREKFDYAVSIIELSDIISAKFVKKLSSTIFYELRLSVANEIRIIIFSVDNENINHSTQIVFLVGFIKKSTKDYNHYIAKAETILNR